MSEKPWAGVLPVSDTSRAIYCSDHGVPRKWVHGGGRVLDLSLLWVAFVIPSRRVIRFEHLFMTNRYPFSDSASSYSSFSNCNRE